MAKLSLPLLLLALLIVFTTSFSCPQHQKEALLHFKASLSNVTSFPSDKEYLLSLFESWNSSSDCCDWEMVSCNPHFGSRNVIALYMGNSFEQLEPMVLASSILTPLFHIRSLTHLDLSWSRIQGELPGDGIANLTKLIHLDLSGNHFSGSIPSQIFNLSYLQYLCVDYNSFNGNIPKEIGNKTKLQTLSLQHNNLFGKIPSSILILKELKSLDLSYNSLSMEIPIDIGNLSNIISLNFKDNGLTGTIPSSIRKLPKLEKLELENNLFIGEIPSWLFNITGLKSLFLGGNISFGITKQRLFQSLRYQSCLWGLVVLQEEFHSGFLCLRILLFWTWVTAS